MKVVAHDPFISAEMAADPRRRARLARRSVRARRLHLASRSRAAVDEAPLQRRTVREVQEGRPHHQHRARRADRRGRAGRRHRTGARRRRGTRRVRPRAAERLAPRHAAAGRGDATHRRLDQGSPGTGRQRDGRGVARLSEGRHHPQRGELPFGLAGGIQAAAAVSDARQYARTRSSRRWAKRASAPSACATTASSPAEDNQLLGSAVLEGVFCADPFIGWRHAGQRAHDCRRARHRARRIAQHTRAQLHEPDLGEAPHTRRRRTLG